MPAAKAEVAHPQLWAAAGWTAGTITVILNVVVGVVVGEECRLERGADRVRRAGERFVADGQEVGYEPVCS